MIRVHFSLSLEQPEAVLYGASGQVGRKQSQLFGGMSRSRVYGGKIKEYFKFLFQTVNPGDMFHPNHKDTKCSLPTAQRWITLFPNGNGKQAGCHAGGGGVEPDPEPWRGLLPGGQAPSLGFRPLLPGLGHPTRAGRGKTSMPGGALSFILIKR